MGRRFMQMCSARTVNFHSAKRRILIKYFPNISFNLSLDHVNQAIEFVC